MSPRRRVQLFAALVVACLAGGAVAVVSGLRGGVPAAGAGAQSAPAARELLGAAQAAGRPLLVFRSLDRRRPRTYGQVAVAELDAPLTRRTLLPLRCDRVHYQAGRGLCVARGSAFAAGFRAKVFDGRLRVLREFAVEGIPSRTRISPDGRLGSTTLFVSGHSYAVAGRFSTQTTLFDVARGRRLGDLEDFAVTRDGRRVTARDRNFWGTTFAADGDTFYATMATGGRTYLVRGSVRGRSGRTIHGNVECPALSPDGTRIAYKKRVGGETKPWRLHVLELATRRETALAEQRLVDDQVEWLDDRRVLYRVDEEIWVTAADGAGSPRRFVAGGDSQAVARPAP